MSDTNTDNYNGGEENSSPENDADTMDKTSVGMEELEDVVIDGANTTTNDSSPETDEASETDDEITDSGRNTTSKDDNGDGNNDNSVDDVAIEDTEGVRIDGAENTNVGDENNEDADGNNTEVERDEANTSKEFTNSDASSNWSGGNEGNDIEATYGTAEKNESKSQSFTPEMENGSINDVKNTDPTTNTHDENNDDANTDSDTEIVNTWGNDDNGSDDERRDNDTKQRSNEETTSNETKNRSERVFGRDESKLDTSDPSSEETKNDETSESQSTHDEINDRNKQSTEQKPGTGKIGINEPSETIQVGETTPPESVGQQSLTGPIGVMKSGAIGALKRVILITRAVIGVILWIGKIAGLVFEVVGTVMMIGYTAVIGMTLISPGITAEFIGVSSEAGRIGGITAASVEYLPIVFVLFFLAALIDEIANEGNRFEKRDRFSRL